MKILGAEAARNNWGQVDDKGGLYTIRIQGHLKKSEHKDASGSWRRDETQGLGLEKPESHFPPTPVSVPSFCLPEAWLSLHPREHDSKWPQPAASKFTVISRMSPDSSGHNSKSSGRGAG